MGLKISSVLDRYGKCVSLKFPYKAYLSHQSNQPSIAQHSPVFTGLQLCLNR